ncbi:hypothetical protein TWF696_003939 [Orbilia brochopaga]|uniref:Uncharacterized protein n=1 Tax=Orbilia brochopaga TaxID=3140254 RepID=A0AAV9V4L1_9PEZI
MFLSTLVLGASFAASISAAVLPRAPQTGGDPNHPEWPDRWHLWAWEGNDTATADFVKEKDNAWIKIDLQFPITMFGKTSKVAWASVDGVFTIDEPNPDVPVVPERALPVDPASCNNGNSAGGCIPDTSIAVLWRDMGLVPGYPKGFLSLLVAFTYHPSLPTPHHHIQWRFCDNKASWDFDPGLLSPCGSALRVVTLTFMEARPGWYNVVYHMDNGGRKGPQGVIGMQSYSEGKHMTLPLSDVFVHGREGMWQVDYDTNIMNYTVSKFIYDP